MDTMTENNGKWKISNIINTSKRIQYNAEILSDEEIAAQMTYPIQTTLTNNICLE